MGPDTAAKIIVASIVLAGIALLIIDIDISSQCAGLINAGKYWSFSKCMDDNYPYHFHIFTVTPH